MKKYFSIVLATVFFLFGFMFANNVMADTTSQLVPIGNGTYTDWTGDYTDVNEGMSSPSCDSGNYINTSTTNEKESFNIDLSTIPNGSTITNVNILVADRSYTLGSDGGTYATFLRFNNIDSTNSNVHTTLSGSEVCTGFPNDAFDIVDTLKNSSTTLEIGVVKLGASSPANRSVRIGAIVVVVTYTLPDTTPPTLHLPSDITTEATSSAGATVIFSATATDINPANQVAICAPASGSVFPLGTTAVNCSATDATSNTANGNFNITVQDTTPPVITISGGNSLSLAVGDSFIEPTASAGDLVDVSLTTASVFSDDVSTAHHGVYHVIYHATDASSNIGTATLTVDVSDTGAPVINGTPSDQIVEATDSSGEIISWTDPTANDVDEGPVPVACAPSSGSIFMLGINPVDCSASDSTGNIAHTSFNITVQDTTAPTITLLGSSTVNLTVGDTYTDAGATASDNYDGDISGNIVTVNPVNTSIVGSYLITYDVADANNNSAIQVIRTVNVNAVPPIPDTTPPVVTRHGGQRFLLPATGLIPSVDVIPTINNVPPIGQILGAAKFNFTKFIKKGSNGNEVMELQKFLNNNNYIISLIGFGSPGNETIYFRLKTRAALMKFQLANGLKGDGIVGHLTRAALNK